LASPLDSAFAVVLSAFALDSAFASALAGGAAGAAAGLEAISSCVEQEEIAKATTTPAAALLIENKSFIVASLEHI
jgi:hypothetical protein